MSENRNIAAIEQELKRLDNRDGTVSARDIEIAKTRALVSIAKSLDGIDTALDGIARYGLPESS